jgi:YesN/AraC family two-component response regulator
MLPNNVDLKEILLNAITNENESLQIPQEFRDKIKNNLNNISTDNISDILGIFGTDCYVGITTVIHDGFKELHHHDFYEILYIRKGNFKFKVDERNYELSPGDIVFVTPETLHVLENVNCNESERVVINVSDKFLEKISSVKTNLAEVFHKVDKVKNYCVTLKPETRTRFDKYINSLMENQVSEEYGADIMYSIKFAQLMILLNVSYDDSLEIDLETENPIIAECVEFIKQNLDKPLVIEDIANYTCLSPSTISHTFKEQTGISVHRYIIKKKWFLPKI